LACAAGSGNQRSSQYREADLASLDLEDARAVSGLEVAFLVEDLVVGQALLEVDLLDAALAKQRVRAL
jgi:hypothetical protein